MFGVVSVESENWAEANGTEGWGLALEELAPPPSLGEACQRWKPCTGVHGAVVGMDGQVPGVSKDWAHLPPRPVPHSLVSPISQGASPRLVKLSSWPKVTGQWSLCLPQVCLTPKVARVFCSTACPS